MCLKMIGAVPFSKGDIFSVITMVPAKTEFGKFCTVLAKTKKKLQEASNTIDRAEVRTRAIERKLRKVQEIPAEDADALLPDASEPP